MKALAGICGVLLGIIIYVGWNIGVIKSQLEEIKNMLKEN